MEKMWVLVGETDREVISTSVWALCPVSLRGGSVRLVDEGGREAGCVSPVCCTALI